MTKIPAKVENRIKEGLKKFKPLIEQAKTRDVGEADTSTLIKDLLADLFGYDKYSEITAEYQIRGTFCDLALKIDGKVALLIEVKAIGLDLKDSFIKQAVDYAANQGIEWVVLTNGINWQVYKIGFTKPISSELLISLNFLSLDTRNESDLDALYLLCREAQGKSLLDDYHEQRQALSKYSIGNLLLTEPVLTVIRRELKRISPDVKIDISEISNVLSQEVIKRDLLEGEKADEASNKISKAASRPLRVMSEKSAPEQREGGEANSGG